MKKILATALLVLSAFAVTVSSTVPAEAKKHHKASKSKSDAEKPADQSSEPAQK